MKPHLWKDDSWHLRVWLYGVTWEKIVGSLFIECLEKSNLTRMLFAFLLKLQEHLRGPSFSHKELRLRNVFELVKLQVKCSLLSQTEGSLTSTGRLLIDFDENLPMHLQSAIVTLLPIANSKARLTCASVPNRSLLSSTPKPYKQHCLEASTEFQTTNTDQPLM